MAPKKFSKKGRIFIIECVSPIDALNGTNESESLRSICEQIGHKTALFAVRNVSEFKNICKYIGSMDEYDDSGNKKTLFIHLSMHGSDNGLAFGKEKLKWGDLFSSVQPICQMDYPGEKIFTLSSCYAINQKLSKNIEETFTKLNDFIPPKYLFFPIDNTINWVNAIVGWTILFHQLPEMEIDDYKKVKQLLNSIHKLGLGRFKYYRWNDTEKKYKHYESKIIIPESSLAPKSAP